MTADPNQSVTLSILITDVEPDPEERYGDLTARMADLLRDMFLADDMQLTNPILAIAEANGATVSSVAAVQRHLHRRGYLMREGENYTMTERATDWWAAHITAERDAVEG